MDAIRDPMSLSDTFSVFFEDYETDRWSSSQSSSSLDDDDWSDHEEGRSTAGSAESKAFWIEQHQILRDALIRRSSIEKRIRSDAEEALRRMQSSGCVSCHCSIRQARDSCRKCMLGEFANQLRDAGYDSALCTSKWRKSPNIPSGDHSYVDVLVEGKGIDKSPIRVVVEPNFRAEFEMARASEEYNELVSRLPEVYVGKAERLKNVVKTMCGAAKRCAKENRMHIAPWRKHKYMQSKWLGKSERMPLVAATAAALPPVAVVPGGSTTWQSRQRASMLTVDLLRMVVEVV